MLAKADTEAVSADFDPRWRLDFCAENDYNYYYLSFFGYLRARRLMEGYWQRLADLGKDD